MNDKIDMLYIEFTKKCNSRCITCDYWKNKKEEIIIDDDDILELIKELKDLKVILFTGGEALLRASKLFEIAKKIKKQNNKIELRLLTNGVLVNKYLDNIVKYFDTIVYSFDANDKKTYKQIRGIDAFELVVDSIRNVKKHGLNIRLRCMILKDNYENLDKVIKLAKELSINQISFIPLDTETTIGFERKSKKVTIKNDIDIKKLKNIISNILKDNEIKESTMLAEKGNNLKNVISFYEGSLKNKYCNSPYSSIVLQMNGDIKTCFFTEAIANIRNNKVSEILNSEEFKNFRHKAKNRKLDECKKCVL